MDFTNFITPDHHNMITNNTLLRYTIIKKIDSGGMSTVFLASDSILDREIALKKLHPHLLDKTEAVFRFTNEAKIIATLSHENIIKIFDYGNSDSGPFLVMEYIDGTTLNNVIETKGIIPNLVAINIAYQIASGLAYAHQKGIYHRDIKPANVLINRDGLIKITDFGIAYLVNSQSVTVTGSFIGSPNYISPEQAQGKPFNGKTDIFSLGVTLYQCVTGEPPFTADMPHAVINSIIHDEPCDIRKKNPAILYWFAELIENCLKKNPDDRPDAVTFLELLKKHCDIDNITETKKGCLIDFLVSPDNYRLSETQELFTLYRKTALDELKSCKVISGLRKFEQATKFGSMSPDDIKIRKTILRNNHVRKIITTIAPVLGIIMVVFVTGGLFLWYHDKHSPKSTPVPETALYQLPTVIDSSLVKPDPISRLKLDSMEENFVVKSMLKPQRDTSEIKARAQVRNQIQTDMTDTIRETDTPKKSGFLSIFTNPPWVTIYIDGIERGKTPNVNLIVVSPGNHDLVLSKEGFVNYKSTFTVQESDTVTIRIRLQLKTQDYSSQ